MDQNNTSADLDDEESFSLLEIATVLGEEKKSIALITALFTTVAVAVSLFLTPIFTAKVIFIVPNPSAGASATQALANLGGLMGGGGAASLLGGGKSSDEMYMAFLKSQSFQNNLIAQFDLQKRYEAKTLDDARKGLKNRTVITSLKKAGLITIEVDDKDPQFAAQLANAYVVDLKKLLENLASTETQMRKQFYERELIRTRKELQGVTDYRDMKVRESVLAVITNQYEVAVMDSARESLIQVAEPATPPEKKSKPKRAILVLVTFFASLFLSTVLMLLKRAYQRAQNDPSNQSAWQGFKKAWSWRR